MVLKRYDWASLARAVLTAKKGSVIVADERTETVFVFEPGERVTIRENGRAYRHL